VLGYAMTAFYGGRAEARIRRWPIPVVYCDFLSMYPTVNALMGLWELLTAERIEVVEDTEAVVEFVRSVTLRDCLRPETWRGFPVLVQVEPSSTTLPVRARYDAAVAGWQIGVNPVHSGEANWYALPDVIAAKLLRRRTPKITRALGLVPIGKQPGLRPIRLRGEVQVDPRTQDFFRLVIEAR